MSKKEAPIFCAGCGVEITWASVRVERDDYCCEDCARGLECACGERLEEDERRGGHDQPAAIGMDSMQ